MSRTSVADVYDTKVQGVFLPGRPDDKQVIPERTAEEFASAGVELFQDTERADYYWIRTDREILVKFPHAAVLLDNGTVEIVEARWDPPKG